jgi:Tetratricopeptide repeat
VTARQPPYEVESSHGQRPPATGNYRGALEVSTETLASSVDLFGEAHPYSHYIAFAHAVNLRCARRLDEARTVTTSLVEQYARVFGVDHPVTNCGRVQLGSTLFQQGDINAALRILTDACNALSRCVGDEHPYFLYGAIDLSNAYGAAGDLLAARQLGVTALETLTRILGASHPFTLAQAVNVCLNSYRSGEEQSLDDHRAAVSAFAAVVGGAHPMVRQLTKLERFSPDVDVMPW